MYFFSFDNLEYSCETREILKKIGKQDVEQIKVLENNYIK